MKLMDLHTLLAFSALVFEADGFRATYQSRAKNSGSEKEQEWFHGGAGCFRLGEKGQAQGAGDALPRLQFFCNISRFAALPACA
jgi:hypothetical protein